MAHSDPGAKQAPDLGRDDDVPVGVQLAWRLRALIRSGRLPAGTRLPGVRDAAAAFGVNVNTARALYRRLEAEQLITSQQGHGTFVADQPGISPLLEQLATETAETASALGLDPRELARTLYVASPTDGAEVAPVSFEDGVELSEVDERDARQTLRAQVARLEAELATHPDAVPAPAGARTFPRVADLGELEATRDELAARLKEALAAAEKEGRRQGQARAHLEEMVAEPQEHRGEIVTNADLGEPGCATWEAGPAWGPVGALMKWWRVKVSSGCP